MSTIAREHNVIFREHVHNMCRNSFYQYIESDNLGHVSST